MVKTLSSTIAAAALATAGAASAQTGPSDGGRIYLGLGLGASYVTDDGFEGVDRFDPDAPFTFSGSQEVDWGGTANIFVGYRVSDRVSIEIESSAWGNERVRNLLSLNAVVWGDQSARVVPYVGAGLGYSRFLDEDGDIIGFYDGTLGYKLKGGTILPVGRSHAFGLEASFVSGADFLDDDDARFEVEQSFDAIGLAATYRYQFGGYPGR